MKKISTRILRGKGKIKIPKYKIYYGVGGTINDITKDNEAYV
ncbi:hypothetical protein CHCC14600_2545 [Bacillus licheniformis]|jgi:hypothetical protein|uniref:Uncharacterized protein n=1 Tax=Bacillus licheniformis TaxID=1402 RepID=A0A8B5Y9T5_BACLI|nr:hypothetical protein B4094_3512 [Bacillus licheniformis]TWJ43089.1 hypothetical protein CHCC5025_3618 [Bacillus licheniformis]TWL25334.1 hypothetical protein CHCC16736_4217 [Bacillus licheniformis]TWL26842.1 hypothetical protein CHCC16874_3232 [Bacillus licheniformis]TWL68782.1 hypothetical protein CHCC15318_1524 [Bacillus licheniformis]